MGIDSCTREGHCRLSFLGQTRKLVILQPYFQVIFTIYLKKVKVSSRETISINWLYIVKVSLLSSYRCHELPSEKVQNLCLSGLCSGLSYFCRSYRPVHALLSSLCCESWNYISSKDIVHNFNNISSRMIISIIGKWFIWLFDCWMNIFRRGRIHDLIIT